MKKILLALVGLFALYLIAAISANAQTVQKPQTSSEKIIPLTPTVASERSLPATPSKKVQTAVALTPDILPARPVETTEHARPVQPSPKDVMPLKPASKPLDQTK